MKRISRTVEQIMKSRKALTAAAALAALAAAGPAWATTHYWDINGTGTGATSDSGGVASGSWLSGTNWSTDSTGGSATVAWPGTGFHDAYFSAGTNATGASTVTLNGSVNVNNLQAQEGNVTISGSGTLNFSSNSAIWGASGASLTIDSAVAVGGGTFQINSPSATTTISGVISGTWANGLQAQNGNTILTGPNTFIAPVYLLYTSTLSFNSIKNVNGGASALGAPTNSTNGTIEFGGATTLKYTGSANSSTDRILKCSSTNGSGFNLLQEGTGTLTFTGAPDLTGNATTTRTLTLGGSPASPAVATAEFSGNILNPSGKTLGVTKSGTSLWILSGANTYAGKTTITGGVLRVASASAIPGGLGASGGTNNIDVQAGVLELGFGDLTRGQGTGATQINLPNGPAGFSAYGANRFVNLGGASAAFTFQSAQTLILGSATANAQIDFQNPINLNGGNRTIQVDDNPNSTADIALVSGNITDTYGSLTKAGAGTLILSGDNTFGFLASNTPTTISAGVLRLASATALSTKSALVLNGGVCELGVGDMTRPLSTSNGANVRFTGSGGFSAHGANRIVNFGGAAAGVTWNSGGFVPTGSTLIFGSSTANAQVEFKNPINLAGATQTIQVDDNAGSTADQALMSGALTNGGLTKTGAGKLILSATNNSYDGATNVNVGTLLVNGSNTAAGAGAAFTVASGATLGGIGTIAGAVGATGTDASNLATVAPGGSVGTPTLTVNNTVTFNNFAKLEIDLVGNTIDKLAATSLSLSSSSDYLVINASGSQGQNRYVFATYTGSLSGNTFNNVTINGLTGASIDYATAGEIAVVVPEPSSALGLLAVGALTALRRRRRA